MRQTIYLILAMVSFTFFHNCEEADLDTDLNYVTLQTVPVNILVAEDGSESVDVNIYTSNIVSTDRTFNIMVDQSSTSADAGTYTVPSSVTVPANSNVGTFTVNIQDTPANGNSSTLGLTLENVDDMDTSMETLVVDITRDCNTSLEGTYEVVSSGVSTDGGAATNPVVDLIETVTISKTGSKTYSISSGDAGLYAAWYCGVYGGGCDVIQGNFTDICGALSGEWTDQYGSTVVWSGTDNFDGTLTVSWENGFGDTGSSIYTKQ